MKAETDIDIDVQDRQKALDGIEYVRASIIDANGNYKPHNVGVYFQDIPYDPCNGLSTINYEDASDRGYFKIDILNVSLYDGIKDENHLLHLMEQEPLWEMLEDDFFIQQLWQIHSHGELLKILKPRTIEQLAMFLGVIRPAKNHLKELDWDEIGLEIWNKPKYGDKGYEFSESWFKKPHAIAYALGIVVQMNLILEKFQENV